MAARKYYFNILNIIILFILFLLFFFVFIFKAGEGHWATLAICETFTLSRGGLRQDRWGLTALLSP